MRASIAAWFTLVSFLLLSGQASAQCCYIAPPRAPDMKGPGFYYSNPYGVVYGPNYNVQPPFPAFQGMLPMPQPKCRVVQAPNGQFVVIPAFAHHTFARSPRDYFMIDTDPRSNPYTYGFVGGARDNGAVPAGGDGTEP